MAEREPAAHHGSDEHEARPFAALLEEEHEDELALFTNEGSIPEVDDGEQQAGPSASDRAYGQPLYANNGDAKTSTKAAKPTPQFTTLKGGKLDATTKAEAAVLRALRKHHIRIDPTWLLEAQTNELKVADATGAMNTETLRAINARVGHTVSADEILKEELLNQIHNSGRAPLVLSAPGDGFASETKNEKATKYADIAAQAVGRADYQSYKDEMVPLTFLGFDFVKSKSDGLAHPYLASRLKLAEDFLRNLFAEQVQKAASNPKGLKGDALVAHLAGWNGEGGARYDVSDAHVAAGKYHQHTMGLAIDIDPYVNGWLWDNNAATHPSINKHLELASRLFGGKKFTAATLDSRSDQTSTEELHGEVSQASSAFGEYLALVKKYKTKHDDAADKEKVDAEIIADLKAKGLEVSAAELKDMLWFAGWFNGAQTRGAGMTALTNIQMPMLVALRDVAGLNWGGAEMSTKENGDFMHFDCRDTAFGDAIIQSVPKYNAEQAKAAKAAKAAKTK